MFRGVSAINLDAKGRMAIPARYRQQMEAQCAGKLVTTIDTEERCLLIYPLQEWEEIERKIEALPSFNRAARRVQRLLIGYATDIEMDSHGRILLPGVLREYAGISKNVMLIGQGKKFELWDEGLWTDKRETWLLEEAEESKEDIPEEMKSISL